MLYILEERHMSRSVGEYLLAVEAETAEEAEKMANEYVKHDKRILNIPLCPLLSEECDNGCCDSCMYFVVCTDE